MECLVEVARPVAAGFARRLVRDQSLAEDYVQEAVFALFSSLPSFDPSQDFMPWARAVMRNTILGGLRQRDQLDKVVTDPEQLPAPRSEGFIETRALIQVLNAMPRDWAWAVVWNAYLGLTFAEMARLTGVSSKTWYSRYTRGCEFLREEIEGWQ